MAPRSHGRPGRWRWGTPLLAALCGLMFWTSYDNSRGIEWRPERYSDLAALVRAESKEVTAQQQQVRDLTHRVDRLTAQVNDRAVSRARARGEEVESPAGLSEVSGSGVTVTMSDAPPEVIEGYTGDLADLVVHQQDIQRVVNALWSGGAEAVTIQGQRVVSTTGIKCDGNAIQLHGRAYPQPFVIQGVGDQGGMLAAIEMDSYLQVFRDQAADPTYQLGWDLTTQTSATAPAYEGLRDAAYASVQR